MNRVYDAVAFDLRHQTNLRRFVKEHTYPFFIGKQKRFVTALTFFCTVSFNSGQGQIRDMETSGLSTSDIPKIRPHEPSCLFLTEGLFSRTVDEKKRINK